MIDEIIRQRNQAKDNCKNLLVDFCNNNLTFNRKESNNNYRKYQCAFCGSGTGKHGTGNLTIYTNNPTTFKCLVCGASGDIYNLASELYGLNIKTEFGEVVQRVFNEFNINVPKLSDVEIKSDYVKPLPIKQPVEKTEEEKTLEEYTLQLAKADIVEAEKHLEECRYLSDRGISLEVQRKFHCGYLKAWVHPQIRAKVNDDYSQISDNLKQERVIIPDGDINNLNSYTARAIHKEDEKGGRKAMKTANPKVFNANVLQSTEPQVVFIVEGAIDSMSIETLGYKSIALGSTTYIKKPFDYDISPHTTFVVALDNDQAGNRATSNLIKECMRKGIYALPADIDIYGSYKDANECLVNARNLLKTNLEKMVQKANDPELKEKYLKEVIRMNEIENNVTPNEVSIVKDTTQLEFPEITFENITSDETLNFFGKLTNEIEVARYYSYLISQAKKFKKYTECKVIFDACKKKVLEHIKDWRKNPNIRTNNDPTNLPEWVKIDERGRVTIDEPVYCQTKIAQHDLRTIKSKLYNIDGQVEEDGLKREIILDISPYMHTNTSSVTNNIFDAIKMYTYHKAMEPDEKNIHLLNGTIDVSRFKQTGSFYFDSQKQWCLNRLNITFNPNAKKPEKFLRFLHEMLEDDDILTLQEYGGYGFLPITDAQKSLFIVGNGANGKSLLGKIYKQLLGDHNVYTAHIHRLQDRPCELANCTDKLINIDDDANLKALDDTGTIKEVVSGGSVTVEPKYVQPYSTTLYTRLLSFSNSTLQALYDRSDGFYRRQLIIYTKPKRKDRVDNPLLYNEIVEDELEGIFNWFLEGLKRLMNNNYHFTVSERSKNLMEESKKESFNFIEYLEDTNDVIFDENASTTSTSLYDNYCSWCTANGKDTLKRNTVLSWLKDHAYEYNITPDGNIIDAHTGRRCRGFKGIKTRSYVYYAVACEYAR